MKRIVSLVLAICLLIPNAALAADLFLAQAANFTPVLKEIIPLFEKATGLQVDATYASTGKLYGQIVNNAPYDMLLAADEKRPDKLHADGLAEKPFVYAKGQVVLWSASKDFCGDDWEATVQNAAVKRVSIANTETAPYGTSSMKAMQAVGVWDTVQPKLVFGQSISQAFQFASYRRRRRGLLRLLLGLYRRRQEGLLHGRERGPAGDSGRLHPEVRPPSRGRQEVRGIPEHPRGSGPEAQVRIQVTPWIGRH